MTTNMSIIYLTIRHCSKEAVIVKHFCIRRNNHSKVIPLAFLIGNFTTAMTASIKMIICSQHRASNTPGGNIKAIHDIILDMFHLNIGETSIAEHLAGDLLTPHRPKPGSIFSQ
jgi:hypothetical protein